MRNSWLREHDGVAGVRPAGREAGRALRGAGSMPATFFAVVWAALFVILIRVEKRMRTMVILAAVCMAVAGGVYGERPPPAVASAPTLLAADASPSVQGPASGGLGGGAGIADLGTPDALSGHHNQAAEHFKVSIIPSLDSVKPGESLWIALEMVIDKGYVFYSPQPSSDADYRPIKAQLAVEAGKLKVEEIRWPRDRAHLTNLGAKSVTSYVYEDQAVAYVKLSVPPDLPEGEYAAWLTLSGQMCKTQCMDLELPVRFEVNVGQAGAANPRWPGAVENGLREAVSVDELAALHAASGAATMPSAATWTASPASGSTAVNISAWAGLGLALLAGLILNVMPCVLPVVPLRILSIVNMAGQSRRRYVTMGIAFSVGIGLFFAGLAGANLVLRLATGQAFNWSMHLQNSAVRIGLAMVVVAMAANMLGAFHVTLHPKLVAMVVGGTATGGSGGAGAKAGDIRGRHATSMGMGLMMAILATPCSFAILATTLAWAQGQRVAIGTAAFLLIGVGMAAPHLVLAAMPGLVKILPRPGRWMELLKQSMGFVMLLVAIWLITTLTSDSYVGWVAAFGVVFAFALWVWGTWVRYDDSLARKLAIRGPAVALTAIAAALMLAPPKPPAVYMAPYDQTVIAAAHDKGQTVVVQFTASWCASCKVVEYYVYDKRAVAAQLKARNVAVFKADVTNAGDISNPKSASATLANTFHRSPPLTVIYPPGDGQKPPILLAGEFSPATLYEKLDQAAR
jgi:thiol:disulfide interchange protein